MKSLVVLSALAVLLAHSTQGTTVGQISHVVHISVDGMGSVYMRQMMNAAPAQFPGFWRLTTNGASTLNARCDFGSSYTMPNHTCMFTGRPTRQPDGMPETTHHGFEINSDDGGTLHTSGNPFLTYQSSAFDVAHDHGLSTAILASKAKFQFFARTWSAAHGAPDATGQDDGTGKIDFSMFTEGSTNPPMYETSAPLVDALLDGLTNAGWNYSFLHFSETDSTGHVYGWGSALYSNSMRHVDFQISRILRAIETNPTLAGSTALIVTSDHGGDGLAGHNFPEVPVTYTIPLFVWGAGIQGGTDAYALFTNRTDPGEGRPDYVSPNQPLRNGDTGNLALGLLGLPPVPGSLIRPALANVSYRMRVQTSDGVVTVSWPVAAGNEALQWADNPQLGWQPITQGIALAGARYTYSVPLSAGSRKFFRLNQP